MPIFSRLKSERAAVLMTFVTEISLESADVSCDTCDSLPSPASVSQCGHSPVSPDQGWVISAEPVLTGWEKRV